MLNKDVKKFDYFGACTFYLGAILVALVGQALISFASVILSQSNPDIATNGDFVTACMIVLQAVNALFIVLYCKTKNNRFDCALAVDKNTEKLDYRDFIIPVIAALVLLVSMYLPTVWYGYFTEYALHISPAAGNIELETVSSVVMIVIASVFMAPVFEESIYRGVLFNGLKRKKSAVKAVLLSALAFMLMHMSPIQVVFQFALGALSAVIMHRTGRLLPSVLLHATANAAALTIQFEPLSGVIAGCMDWLVANPTSAVFITLALLIAGGGVLFVLVRFGYGKTDTQNAEAPQDDEKLTPETAAKQALAEARSKDGNVRYWIATAVSGVLFIINLITMIAG
ncbi:MAG: CPBP family intramembrane metalloprotease [Clostridiales bacterium]|nr:CPBP family intramembrane metalloprotease [Clostridiales bacterium]